MGALCARSSALSEQTGRGKAFFSSSVKKKKLGAEDSLLESHHCESALKTSVFHRGGEGRGSRTVAMGKGFLSQTH